MKHILVTGASGNLGKALVHKFLAAGHKVSGLVIPNDPQTFDPDPEFARFEADLNNESGTEQTINRIIADRGAIHAAILTAGGFAMGSLSDTGSNDIMGQYRLNFETAYHVVRPLFSHMKEQGYGRIFLVGSRPGADMKAGKKMIGYALSKSLVFRLAEILNAEAGNDNLVCSVIVPSTIDTPQNREAMPNADFSTWMDPNAMASIVEFYCSPEADGLREPILKMYNKA
jgi:NAD(P)-dependent dehydrogenase (short-subunit alcohol dehydrogenase family)